MTTVARTPARYWAVRFAPDTDTVLSCKRVFDVDAANEDCFIVEARSADGAADLARGARQRQLRRRAKERRELYRDAGLCRCGRAPKPGLKQCEACLASCARQNRRQSSGAPPLSSAERSAATSGGRMRSQDAIRLRVLLEVQQWWREALTVDAFARRVALEIQQLSERARSDAA